MAMRQLPARLSDETLRTMTSGFCPVCGHHGFVLGPRGGSAQNIECGNFECRARFNVLCVGGEMLMGNVIPREIEGGTIWPSGQHTPTSFT